MADTLQRDFDLDAPSGMRDKSVSSALNLHAQAKIVRDQDRSEWEDIAVQYANSFKVKSGDTIQVYSKLMYQAHMSVVKRMKRPDRRFLADKLDELSLEIVRDGINTVQDLGGYTEALISDWGAYHKFLLFGNAFVMMGTGVDIPVSFQNVNLMNVYVDPHATTMRNPAGESDVSEILIIFEYSYDEAKALYPNKKFFPGKLPIGQEIGTELHFTNQQESEIQKRVVQIGHYYNISDKKNPVYTIMAGESATILNKDTGDNYKFRHNGSPFVPVLHFKCFPQPAGFYAKGLGHLLYDLGVVEQKIDNMAYAHVEENVYPVTILNTTAGSGKQFLSDIYASRELKALGERSYVVNQVPQTGGGATLETLRSDPLTQEYERIKADIITKIKRSGFPIDEQDIPASQTATASTIEASALTSFVQQIQEVNTETYKYTDLFTIDMVRDTITTDDKTPIITEAELPDGTMVSKALASEGEPITLGDVVDILENNEIIVDVVSRSGAHKDPIAEKLELNEILPLVQGTPLATKMLAKRIRMNGFKVNEQDLIQQQNAGLGQIPQSPKGAPQGGNALGEAGGVSGLGDVLG